MGAMSERDNKGLPRAIPAQELQTLLGANGAFCSWDASHLAVSELVARWPFLFSHPLMGTNQKTTK
jgi:hypothetical protein